MILALLKSPLCQVPPPPPFARPSSLPPAAPIKEFSSPAVISKPAVHDDDEDIFASLLKAEKEVRADKKERKHFEKKKKEMGLDGGVSMMKPPAPAESPPASMPMDIPRDITQLSAGNSNCSILDISAEKQMQP